MVHLDEVTQLVIEWRRKELRLVILCVYAFMCVCVCVCVYVYGCVFVCLCVFVSTQLLNGYLVAWCQLGKQPTQL